MTERKKSTLRTRTTVPVSSRTAAQRGRGGKTAVAGRSRKKFHQRFDLISVAVMVSVVLVILLSVAVPLRNYYEGRAEIARLEDSIAAKKAEKLRVEDEIERYKDADYVREQARSRFGLVEPGETAYRIIDPRITNKDSVTTSRQDYEEARPWYAVLWDAIAEPPEIPEPADAPKSTDGEEVEGDPVAPEVPEHAEDPTNR